MPREPHKPSWRFRLWQVFYLPWRLVCLVKGHTWHKWACARCLAVDHLRLACHHINHWIKRRRWPWER
jgi:hypothetical protein